MEDTIHNDLFSGDFKKRPVITRPHPVFREMIAEAFDVAPQIILQPPQALDHPGTVRRRQTLEVLFRLGFELDAVVHGWIPNNCRKTNSPAAGEKEKVGKKFARMRGER
jgi:hypothetical protein